LGGGVCKTICTQIVVVVVVVVVVAAAAADDDDDDDAVVVVSGLVSRTPRHHSVSGLV